MYVCLLRYLLIILAQPVNCNLWADKNLAQAAVCDKATTEVLPNASISFPVVV